MFPRWIDRVTVATLVLMAGCSGQPPRTGEALAPTWADAFAQDIATELRQATASLRAGDAPQAEEMLAALSHAAPDNPLVWINLGIAELRLDRPQAAVSALERACELSPSSAATYDLLGVAYRHAGRIADAKRAYHAALDRDAEFARVHYNLGILYDIYLQRPRLAVQHYRHFTALSAEPPTEVTAWITQLENGHAD